jgi:hypothetical protein
VSATTIAGGSYAGRVIALLSAWPAVRADRADCGVGIGLGTQAGQILHFHDESYADLRLTRPVIGRMHEVLAESGRVLMVPDDDWIGMPLETSSDAALLVTLVSLAIKANTGASPVAPSCGMNRVRAAVAG